MSAGVLALPEPQGYRWILDTGEVRFNDDAADPPCDAYEEWSVCAALYDADQLREAVDKALAEARATVAELIAASERAVKWMDAVVRADSDTPKSHGIRSWKAEMRHVQGRGMRPEWLYKPTMTAAQARRQLALELQNAQVMLQQAIDRAAGSAK